MRAKVLARQRDTGFNADAYRLKKYGMNRWAYEAFLEIQKGLCSICRGTMVRPCVDHDHKTGEVRGLLCNPCNQALGLLQDHPEYCLRAAEYLKEHQT